MLPFRSDQILGGVTVVPKADHFKSSSSFSDSKYFFCSTCHKCVFNANHDAYITKFLKDVNSRAKIQPNKTRNNTKPIDQKIHTQKPVRFSPNKTSAVYEKTSPRSDLRWKPMGRIFKTVGSYALSWKPCQGDSLNLPDHIYSIYTIKRETRGLDEGVAASFQRSRIHKPRAHTQAFKVNHSAGITLGFRMSMYFPWPVLLDRFQSKLSLWKANLLSIRGRHTLIKAVLGSLGIYYFLIFKVPEYILNSLERSRAMFLWGVLKLLTSLVSKSGVGGCHCTRTRSGLKLSKLYMIRKVALITMVASISVRGLELLYRLESEKDCLIIHRIDHGQWRWNWSRPNLGARNSTDLLDMLVEISFADINEVEDTCVWSLGTDGSFSVKDA
ncbi:hypothetical protein Tco_0704053 [Tanacetum coccineum]|uniref:Uncharacterized protein n=1 Tax=Tanacetum coccineum TaxID=301880 RepID=A0ABQ4Y204_9ASTR